MSDEEDRLAEAPVSVEQLIETITPSVYETLKTAVEIGRWEDGSRLSQDQVEQCMQAIILYEAESMPEDQRTGALLSGGCKSQLDS